MNTYGALVMAQANSNNLSIIDLPNEVVLVNMQGHNHKVESIVTKNSLIYSADTSGMINIWDPRVKRLSQGDKHIKFIFKNFL